MTELGEALLVTWIVGTLIVLVLAGASIHETKTSPASDPTSFGLTSRIWARIALLSWTWPITAPVLALVALGMTIKYLWREAR